jgi:membrane protease YdiL (CAAX protease family)
MPTSAGIQTSQLHWKPIVSIVVSTLVLVIFNYQQVMESRVYSGLILFGAVPLMIILLIFRDKPSQYGVQIGNWRTGLLYAALACLTLVVLLRFVVKLPGVTSYYAPQAKSEVAYPILNAIELLDWELFFRGFLMFSLAELCGPYAILLQAVPFTLAHLGKPYIETVSCIFGGSLFGWIAWKTRSFIYPYIIHVFLASYVIYLASR